MAAASEAQVDDRIEDTEDDADDENQDSHAAHQETDENQEANTARPSTRASNAARREGGASSSKKASQRLPLKRKPEVHPEEASKEAVQRLTEISKKDTAVTIHCRSAEFRGRQDVSEWVTSFHGNTELDNIEQSIRDYFQLSKDLDIKILGARSQEQATIQELTTNEYHEHFVLKVNNDVAFEEFSETLPSLPHQDLHNTLAKGSYTLLIALCELIDNSVQATSGNKKELQRKIAIGFHLANAMIKISDNGRGWDVPSEFSSLGYGTHQRGPEDESPQPAKGLLGHFFGNISRYGVGGKFAEALLGNLFTLETKTKGGACGYTVAYGKKTHFKFEKQTWSAAARGMDKDASFSKITVEEVDVQLFEQCKTRAHRASGAWFATLAKDLRKIYFPYLQLEDADGKPKMGVSAMFERWIYLLENTKAWAQEPVVAASNRRGGRKRKKPDASVESGFECVDTAHAALLDQLRRAKTSSDLRASVNSLVGLDLDLDLEPDDPEANDPIPTICVGGHEITCRWDFIFGPAACDCMPIVLEVPNPDLPGKESTVRIFVPYFAHTGGEQLSLQKMLEREESVDGFKNKSHAGYFWNGRFLPNEQLEPEFMRPSSAPKNQQKALERCYSRAYAVVFLDRNFQVQLNKQALDQNSAMYTALQEKMKDPDLCKAFVAYLQGCNKAHDDEVKFSPNGGKPSVFNEQTHNTTHFHAQVEQTNYSENDMVNFWKKTEGKSDKTERLGIISCFEQDGNEEEGGVTGTVLIVEVVGKDVRLPVERYRLNLFGLERLALSKFSIKEKELAKNLALSLEWVNPPKEFLAGEKLKNLTVSCLSGVEKPKKAKKGYLEVPYPKLNKCQVTLEVTGPDAGEPHVYALDLKRDSGKFVLESGVLSKDDDSKSFLTKVGAYKFVFSLNNGVLATEPLTCDVEVVSDAVATMELANEAELSEPLRMGQELPVLRFRLFDGCGNVFALHGKSMSVHNVIVLGEGTLDVSAAKAKVVKGLCEITGLKLESGPMGDWTVRVEVMLDHITTGHTDARVRLKVDPGKPVSIERVIPEGTDHFVTNLSKTPLLEFELKDSSGNLCTNFNGWAMLTCPALTERPRCRVAHGKASFPGSSSCLTSPVYSYARAPEGYASSTKKGKDVRRSGRGAAANKNSEYEVVKPKSKDVNGIFLGDREFFQPCDMVMIQVKNSGDEPAVLTRIDKNSVFEVERFQFHDDDEVRRLAGTEIMKPENDGIGCIRGRAFVFGSKERFETTAKECRGKHVYWTDDANLDAAAATIPFDVFLFKTSKEPERSDYENVRLHSRELIEIRDSRAPFEVTVVRECREAAERGPVFLPVSGPLQGKPKSKFENLQLEVKDETGEVLCARSATEGGSITCGWASEESQELKYSEDGRRILLPCLEVSDKAAKNNYSVTLSLKEMQLNRMLPVYANAGDPEKLLIEAASVHEVGKDSGFQLTVADTRNTDLAPQEAGEKWDLEIVEMTVFSDEERFESRFQVRKEDYRSGNQDYTTGETPVAKPYRGGIFMVEHVRPLGKAGPMRVEVTARLTIKGGSRQDADSMGDDAMPQGYTLKGSFDATLDAGEARRLAVRGYESPHGSGSQDSKRITVSAKSYATVDRIVVDFVDECNNRVRDLDKHVVAKFNAAHAKALAKRTGRAGAPEVVELQRYQDGYLLEDVIFTSSGIYEGKLQCTGYPHLEVDFEVGASDRVVALRLDVPDEEVQVGGWVQARLEFECEDHSEMERPQGHAVSMFCSNNGHILETKFSDTSSFNGNVLELSVKMPLEFPNSDPAIALGAKFEGSGYSVETTDDRAATLTLLSGPISALTVTRASAIRPTQGSQFAEQPKLDGAGRFLIIPDLLLTACDEHGNRCNSLLEATVEAELRMQGEAEEELALHGDELSFQLSPERNPIKVQGLKAKLLRDVGIQNYDFGITFHVTPAQNVTACVEEMSYHSDVNTQEKIMTLETEESFRKVDVEEQEVKIKETKQEMRKLKVLPSEEEREEFRRRQQDIIDEKTAELERREREEQGEPAKWEVDLSADSKPQGLIGTVVHMIAVKPHPQAVAIRDALAATLRQGQSAAVFESDEALDAHKANENERRRCKLGRVFVVPRMIPPKLQGFDGKKAPEGYVGLLADFADVDERRVPDKSHQEAARRLFRTVCGNAIVFETYQHAIDQNRKMARQNKPTRRAVGLDRPREVIDGDGGQDLQSARREPTVKLAIRSFADSPERTKLRQEIDAAKAEIDQLQENLGKLADLERKLESEKQQRDKFAQTLEEVRTQLAEARRHAERH